MVRGRSGEDGNDYSSSPDGVPPDGYVVNVLQKVHAECVDEPLADEYSGIDTDRDPRFWDEVGVERRKR